MLIRIDADLGIYLNGGLVVASGSRNDSPTSLGSQQFMELFFQNEVPAQSEVKLLSGEQEIIAFTAERAFTSLTLSAPSMALDVPYSLTVNGVPQAYTGMMGGFDGMFQPPHGGDISLPEGSLPTEGSMPDFEIPNPPEPPMEPSGKEPPSGEEGQKPTPPEGENGQRPTPPDGQMPEMPTGNMQPTGQGGTDFVISDENHSFSGVCDAN